MEHQWLGAVLVALINTIGAVLIVWLKSRGGVIEAPTAMSDVQIHGKCRRIEIGRQQNGPDSASEGTAEPGPTGPG